MSAVVLFACACVAAALAVGYVALWRQLPLAARVPSAVYVVSYVLTYAIGGVLIGVTDGEVLTGYFRDRLYIPSLRGIEAEYWIVLLAPLVLPLLIPMLMLRHQDEDADSEPPRLPSVWLFGALFLALAGYAVFRVFHGANGLLSALSTITAVYGDAATIIERRLELFDPGTTASFGIIYSALPALSHVALFGAAQGDRKWRIAAVSATLATVGLSLATFQIAPAVVFIGAVMLSAAHLGMIRMTRTNALAWGAAFLVLLQALNGWKFAEWSTFENLQHIVFRMPAAFPYYLDAFPSTVGFLGADWMGALTGRGADPGSPFVVARVMYPDAVNGSAMAAPAHVQGYAEAGVLNAMLCVLAAGALIACVAALHRRRRSGALAHSLYIQGLMALYYATQTSYRGVLWHSYGFYWSLLALAPLAALSLQLEPHARQPVETDAAFTVESMRPTGA